MNPVAVTDRLGFETHYYRTGEETSPDDRGPTIRSLFESCPTLSTALDHQGLLGYLRRSPDGESTCYAAVRRVPAGSELLFGDGTFRIRPRPPLPAAGGSLIDVLAASLERSLADGRAAALALSGGLDSALLAALLRKSGVSLPVYILDARLDGYRELDAALATARSLGVPGDDIIVIDAEEPDFTAALPDAVAAAEVPLYNLHPISKLLIARRMREDGIEVVITGDGADQVFAGAPGVNYIPIVGAIFRSVGVRLRSPFARDEVIACARSQSIDRHKSALRQAATHLVPDRVLKATKQPRLTPPLAIAAHYRADIVARVARELGLQEPLLETDPERVLWTTIGLLVERIESAVEPI